uniref:Uncharacterized protein n=1 Tax=Arundo donax TaxID=35708 RepID=A0A0A8Y0E5_ARUDO
MVTIDVLCGCDLITNLLQIYETIVSVNHWPTTQLPIAPLVLSQHMTKLQVGGEEA